MRMTSFVHKLVSVGPAVRIVLIVLQAMAELVAEPDAQASGGAGAGRGNVELAVREDRCLEADATVLQRLALHLMDRHHPGQADRKLPPPHDERQGAGRCAERDAGE